MSAGNPQAKPSPVGQGPTPYVEILRNVRFFGRWEYFTTCWCTACRRDYPEDYILTTLWDYHWKQQAKNKPISFDKPRKLANNYHHMQIVEHPNFPDLKHVGPDIHIYPIPDIARNEYLPDSDEEDEMENIQNPDGEREREEIEGDEDEGFFPGDGHLPERTFHSILHDFARLKLKGSMSEAVYKEMMGCVRKFAKWFSNPNNAHDLEKIPKTWDHHLNILREDSYHVPLIVYLVCIDKKHAHITQDLARRCPEHRCYRKFYKNKPKRKDATICGTVL